MVVVTASAGTERSGCLVGFHMQCSISPRRWLVCLSKSNHTYPVAAAAPYLAVHFLHEDQQDLARLFGGETDDRIDKFTQCAWQPGPHGTLVLDGCDYMIGRVAERHDLGDHVGHVLDVLAAETRRAGGGLLRFQTVRGMKPGHEP